MRLGATRLRQALARFREGRRRKLPDVAIPDGHWQQSTHARLSLIEARLARLEKLLYSSLMALVVEIAIRLFGIAN